MRPLFAYLRADVVPTAVFAASEDFGHRLRPARCPPGSSGLRASWPTPCYGRPRSGPVDPFADPTPFEQLLGGAS